MIRIITVLLAILLSIDSQGAEVKGRVVDVITGEILVGATVLIKELKTGTITGLDGKYIIKDIKPGRFKIALSYLGYKSVEKEISIISNDEILVIDFSLESVDQMVSEVQIIASNEKSTDRSARLSEKTSMNIINVISARTIELSPDLTIANVVQRMSGVNLEKGQSGDGQYATLRGMDKRYNYTLVNGVKIPSTNNKYRYMPLNLFPSDMVERLEVTKALTPDMEGDAIGGVVNMIMKNAPDRLQGRINLAIGYSQAYFNSDFTGFNSRNIASISPYELNGSGYTATESDFSKENLRITAKNPLPDIIAGFSVGSRYFNRKLGVLISGSLQSTYRSTESLFFDVSNTNDERNLPVLDEMQNRQYSNHETLAGIHSIIDFSIDNRNRIKLYSAYINQLNDQVRETSALLFNSYTVGNGSYTMEYDTRIRHRVQSLFNSTLQGEHNIGNKLILKWSGAWSVASQQTPDNVNIALVSDFIDYIEQEVSVVEKSSTRRWEHNLDNDITGLVDFKYSIIDKRIKLTGSAGLMARQKYRTSYYNRYRLIPVSERPAPFQNFSQRGIDWNTFDEIHWQILNPPDPTHALNYDASEDVIAGYMRFDMTSDRVEITGGLRLSNIIQGYILHYEQYGSEPIGENTYFDLLPSMIIKYKAGEKQNIRASYFRGINLPGFLEIVPYLDKSEEYNEGGNSELKRCIADNFDLRYEIFPAPLDQFMLGVFYKRIHDPIEYGFTDYAATQSTIYIPMNYGSATNYGLETDYIKNLRNFSVNANYTYTNSEIVTDKILAVRNTEGNLIKTFVKQARPLFGQSEHTANISLAYKNLRAKLDFRISATYSSEKIAVVSQTLGDDIWEKGGIRIDLSAEKTIGSRVAIFIKAQNLLNTPREQFLKLENPSYSEYPQQDYEPGKTLVRRDIEKQAYLIGIRYKFN